jgi:hypothetical protein
VKGLRPALATNLGVLYATDCFNLFAALKNDSVDCVFADPPFNLGKDYGRGAVKDALERRDYLKWSFAWIDECVRLLKPGGALFVYILPSWGYHLASHIEERGMLFRHWVAMSMQGTFPRGRKLYPAHYALLYFSNGEPKTFDDMLAAYGDRVVVVNAGAFAQRWLAIARAYSLQIVEFEAAHGKTVAPERVAEALRANPDGGTGPAQRVVDRGAPRRAGVRAGHGRHRRDPDRRRRLEPLHRRHAPRAHAARDQEPRRRPDHRGDAGARDGLARGPGVQRDTGVAVASPPSEAMCGGPARMRLLAAGRCRRF